MAEAINIIEKYLTKDKNYSEEQHNLYNKRLQEYMLNNHLTINELIDYCMHNYNNPEAAIGFAE